ncbi:MAG TPA: twin-arginine translocase TatA/TatE family subunit [Blastocatellia bacterium]|nr:twin-arginine translocase TatA/TatE family subunit [Blastocatellia bacterium]
MFEGIFQPLHLIIVLAIVLLLFGPKKLPELSKGLGQAIRGFKRALHEEPDSGEKKSAEKETEAATPSKREDAL